MQAKKKAGAAKKKSTKKVAAKKVAAKRGGAKKVAAKKRVTGKLAARKAPPRKAAAAPKRATRTPLVKKLAARKPIAAKKLAATTKQAIGKAPARRKKAPPPEVHERALPDLLADVPVAEVNVGPFEASRDPVRGGLHDRANHSKPEVALRNQNLRALRSPERRHTMRGH